VVIDHEVMLGGFLHHAAIPVDHPLIVAVHKIDLDPGDAPLFEKREGLVHVFVDRGPVRPKPDANILFLRVAQQFGEIDGGIEVGNVGRIGIVSGLRCRSRSGPSDGGFRLRMMLDSIRRPGVSPIITTRQGVWNGVLVSTATSGESTLGESAALRV
jgi:hypothetical protein